MDHLINHLCTDCNPPKFPFWVVHTVKDNYIATDYISELKQNSGLIWPVILLSFPLVERVPLQQINEVIHGRLWWIAVFILYILIASH